MPTTPRFKRRFKRSKEPIEVLTVGHSTRTTKEFEKLLIAHGVEQLVDVRTIPRSRHNPQFNADRLLRSLQKVGIRYCHMVGLGGLRHAHRDSMNTAWRNASFRGFADYMQTPEFKTALDELIRLAQMRRTAIMCAEAVPWRCHRSLIADALLVRGIHVAEITSGTHTRPHTLTPWARVVRKRVIYPAAKAPGSNSPRNLESEFERQPRLVSKRGNRASRSEMEEAWPTERCASRLSVRTARSPNLTGRSSNSGGGRA